MVLIFQDVVAEIAMKWTKIMKTGGIRVQFSGVDLSTIMFSMDQGRDTMEVSGGVHWLLSCFDHA